MQIGFNNKNLFFRGGTEITTTVEEKKKTPDENRAKAQEMLEEVKKQKPDPNCPAKYYPIYDKESGEVKVDAVFAVYYLNKDSGRYFLDVVPGDLRKYNYPQTEYHIKNTDGEEPETEKVVEEILETAIKVNDEIETHNSEIPDVWRADK
jgi:hypothetical protein